MIESQIPNSSHDVLYRLHMAENRHDLDGLIACFAPEFKSEQPGHPELGIVGRNELHETWKSIFMTVPDLQSELLRSVCDGDSVWAEWCWYGNQLNGQTFELHGVTIYQVKNEQIIWERLFIESLPDSSERK